MPALTVGELAAFLDLDDSSYNKKIDKAEATGERLTKKTIRPTVDVDTSSAHAKLGALGSLISENSSSITGAGQKMTLGVTLPILGLDAVSLKLAGDLEQSKIAFETMLGSKPKADAFVASLQKFAATTPFEFTDLQLQAKRMIAYGFAAEQILPMLTNVGDATAALGDPQALETITRAIGQIQSKGKASAEEMLQLSEAGIPAWQMLADSMGESVAQVQKDVTAGTVSSQQAIDALMAGMADKYGGLMAKQSKTLLGQLSNTMDSLKMSAAKFGASIAPIVKPALDVFTGLLNIVSELPKPVLTVVGVLGGIAAVIGPSLWALGGMAQGLNTIKEVFGALKSAGIVGNTTLISENTVAVEANTTAREKNALTPPIGSTGVNPVSPLGPTRGGGGAKGAGNWIKGLLGGILAGGTAMAIGGSMDTVNLDDQTQRELEDQTYPGRAAQRAKMEDIAKQIEALDPAAAGSAAKLKTLTDALIAMQTQLKSTEGGSSSILLKDITKVIDRVKAQAKTFTDSTKAVEDHAAALKEDAEAAIMAAQGNSQLALLLDAERIAAEKGAWLTAQQAADLFKQNALANALKSTEAMAKANPNMVSSSTLFGAGTQGLQKPKITGLANEGIVKATPGGSVVRVAEGGQDEAVVKASRLGGTTILIQGNTFVGSSRDAARQITAMVKQTLGPQVARLERGMVSSG